MFSDDSSPPPHRDAPSSSSTLQQEGVYADDSDHSLGARSKRSESFKYYVETYIVADDSMYLEHGRNTAPFLLSAMNMVRVKSRNCLMSVTVGYCCVQ